MSVVSYNVLAPQYADGDAQLPCPVAGGAHPAERPAAGQALRTADFAWAGVVVLLVRRGPHGPALEVAACTRVFDEPRDGLWCSDHFGVAADLVAPSRPVGSTGTLRTGEPHAG